MQGFWTFLGATMFFAAIANICYFVAVGRLISKGVRVKFLAMPQDTFRVLRQYRALAQENEWPLWPLHGFWMSLIPFAVSAVASIYLVDLRTVQELMGHKGIQMTVRYSHLTPKHTLAAVERLAETVSATPTGTKTSTGPEEHISVELPHVH
jgi:integrase